MTKGRTKEGRKDATGIRKIVFSPFKEGRKEPEGRKEGMQRKEGRKK
jgi:hypothetical protein